MIVLSFNRNEINAQGEVITVYDQLTYPNGNLGWFIWPIPCFNDDLIGSIWLGPNRLD
jgi:hypothetical protein